MPHLAHRPRPSLSTDQLWAVATAGLAAVTVALALAGLHDAGIVTGVLCVIAGGWSQMVSETTAERFETVTATIVGAVALAYCAANSSGLFT